MYFLTCQLLTPTFLPFLRRRPPSWGEACWWSATGREWTKSSGSRGCSSAPLLTVGQGRAASNHRNKMNLTTETTFRVSELDSPGYHSLERFRIMVHREWRHATSSLHGSIWECALSMSPLGQMRCGRRRNGFNSKQVHWCNFRSMHSIWLVSAALTSKQVTLACGLWTLKWRHVPYLTTKSLNLSQLVFTAVVISLSCVAIFLNQTTYFWTCLLLTPTVPLWMPRLRIVLGNTTYPQADLRTEDPYLYQCLSPTLSKPRLTAYMKVSNEHSDKIRSQKLGCPALGISPAGQERRKWMRKTIGRWPAHTRKILSGWHDDCIYL